MSNIGCIQMVTSFLRGCRPAHGEWRTLAGTILLLAALGVSGAQAAPLKTVVIVFKTHFDIGYTDMASNVVTRYRTTMIDQALKVVEANRGLPQEQQFAWTLPGWPLKKITEDWPGQSVARKEQVMQAFHDGRFVVHALPFTTHTELLEPEDLVRGMRFSSDLARVSGLPLPRDAKMTDVPSHSWILPTLLRHAGVEFLHLGCNAASRSPQVPRLFWWEGPDGSRLLTMYTAEFYGTGLTPPPDWPYATWLALTHTGDNHGPPTPDEVGKLLAEAAIKLPGVQVKIGRLSDFSDAILAEQAPIPVVRGDMPDTWIHGPMSDPHGASLARRVRPTLVAAESLGTHLGQWGISVHDPVNALAGAYENSLLYGEHTWGGAFTWIYGKYVLSYGDAWAMERAAGRFSRIESSWDEHTAYIEKAHHLVEPILSEELGVLAASVKVDGPRVVVFNPLPWRRSGVVETVLPTGIWALNEVGSGRLIPVERDAAGRTRFVAMDVPPSGYRTYALGSSRRPATSPGPASGMGATLENKWFRLTLDGERGVVTSWLDKRTGRDWVDSSAPQGFGQYLHEWFDRDQVQGFVKDYVKITADWGLNELGKPTMPAAADAPRRAVSPVHHTIRLEETGVGMTATVESGSGMASGEGTATRWTLYRQLPCMDVEITVRNKPFDPWPEAGWLCLPFRVDDPQFRLARLGSVVDPASDFVAGCNMDQIALNGGLTAIGPDGRGIGMVALDSPTVSLGEPRGWRYSKTWSSRKSRVYVNLFNNQWSTNFRLWNSGTWTSRVRLWPVSGPDLATGLIRPADEARAPLLAAVADGKGGRMDPTRSGLELGRPGVKLTAFGPNPDGAGTLLRVWESVGQTGVCKVWLPGNWKTGRPVDLRGRSLGPPVAIKARVLPVPVQAYAPASWILE